MGKFFIDIFEFARADPKEPIEMTVGVLAGYGARAISEGSGLGSECNAATIRRARAVHLVADVEVGLWRRVGSWGFQLWRMGR
jgi:pyridoxine 4-dehydrogenase